MSWYRWRDDTLLLFCHLQPQASRDEFAGLHGERLKIRINAPPVDGKANARLTAFLAQRFGVPKTAVDIIAGASGRQKTVSIRRPAILPDELGIAPP